MRIITQQLTRMKLKKYVLIAIAFCGFLSMQAQQTAAVLLPSAKKTYRSQTKAADLQARARKSKALITSGQLVQIYDSVYIWNWDSLNLSWNLESKWVDIVYDGNNNITDMINKEYQNMSWVLGTRISNVYDSNNNQTNETQYTWNGSGWDNSYKTAYTYDSNNNQLSEENTFWDGNAWENDSKFTSTYDAKNNKVTFVYQTGATSGWDNATKNIYSYDANDSLTGDILQNWDSAGWINFTQRLYTYDSNNIKIAMLYQLWSNPVWDDIAKSSYDYLNGNLIGELFQNNTGTTYENYWRSQFSYDANNNRTGERYQKWMTGNWINMVSNENAFDTDNFMKNAVSKNFDETGVKITEGDSLVFHYHTTTTGILSHAADNAELKIYPNPSNGQFRAQLEHGVIVYVELYNLTGQKILQQKSGVIDVSIFPKGVYLIRIKDATEQVYTKRVMIN